MLQAPKCPPVLHWPREDTEQGSCSIARSHRCIPSLPCPPLCRGSPLSPFHNIGTALPGACGGICRAETPTCRGEAPETRWRSRGDGRVPRLHHCRACPRISGSSKHRAEPLLPVKTTGELTAGALAQSIAQPQPPGAARRRPGPTQPGLFPEHPAAAASAPGCPQPTLLLPSRSPEQISLRHLNVIYQGIMIHKTQVKTGINYAGL